jgi:hypothetical protein
MCLICESGSKIRRTFFGRTCYKVLMETTDGEFRAPYHTSFVYEIGKVYRMKGLEMRCCEVNQGFHGFIRIEDSVLVCKSLNAISKSLIEDSLDYAKLKRFVVVKCRIPFFSCFIEGKDESGGEKAVVSDRIKIVRIIS